MHLQNKPIKQPAVQIILAQISGSRQNPTVIQALRALIVKNMQTRPKNTQTGQTATRKLRQKDASPPRRGFTSRPASYWWWYSDLVLSIAMEPPLSGRHDHYKVPDGVIVCDREERKKNRSGTSFDLSPNRCKCVSSGDCLEGKYGRCCEVRPGSGWLDLCVSEGSTEQKWHGVLSRSGRHSNEPQLDALLLHSISSNHHKDAGGHPSKVDPMTPQQRTLSSASNHSTGSNPTL